MSLIKQLEAYHRVQNRISQLQQKGRQQEAQQLIDTLEQITTQQREPLIAHAPSTNGGLSEMTQLLRDTIKELKLLTEIRATASITYDLVTIESVKKALLTDNIRMEQFQYNLTISETERFHSFCSSAFKQVENLLNYYYYCKFPDFKDCVSYFKNKGTKFEDNKEPQKLSQIQAHSKLYCFEKDYYYDQTGKVFYDSQLDLIRQVRNLESHRCDVYRHDYEKHQDAFQSLKEKMAGFKKNGLTYSKDKKDLKIEKDGKLAEFIRNQNFDSVRAEVEVLYERVTSVL